MRDLEDQPPSYEDVVAGEPGGEPPKYSTVAETRDKQIRIINNISSHPNPSRIPPHVAPGRVARGKWYGRHNLVPTHSSAPVGTLCQREASQAAVNRLWIRQEGSLSRSFPTAGNKEFSNLCIIILMVALVLSLLVLLQPWGGPYASYTAVSELEDGTTELPFSIESPIKPHIGNCREEDCWAPPPLVKDGILKSSHRDDLQSSELCHNIKFVEGTSSQNKEKHHLVLSQVKDVEFFKAGTMLSLDCQKDKVLSMSPVYLDPFFTGELATEMEFQCQNGNWMYKPIVRVTLKEWRSSKYGKWVVTSQAKNRTEQIQLPVECITQTQLIKQQIG